MLNVECMLFFIFSVIQEELFVIVLGLVSVCFILEIIGLILSLILMLYRYPCKKVDRLPSGTNAVRPTDNASSIELSNIPDDDAFIENGKHCAELVGRTPINLKAVNDGLTVISLLLAILYTTKSAFYPDKSRFGEDTSTATSKP